MKEKRTLISIFVRIRQTLRSKETNNQINDIESDEVHESKIFVNIESIEYMYIKQEEIAPSLSFVVDCPLDNSKYLPNKVIDLYRLE